MGDLTTGKLCKRCKIIKPSNLFTVDKAMPDGLRLYCKTCVKNYKPKRTNNQLNKLTKTCAKCKRSLPGTRFMYDQYSLDKLTTLCRTCGRAKAPVTADICENYEKTLAQLCQTTIKEMQEKYGEDSVNEILKNHSSEFEERTYKTLYSAGLLQDWEAPEWIHYSSYLD